MNRPNRPTPNRTTPNRTTPFSIRNLLIATAIVAIILPWIRPSIQWLKLHNDRPNVTVPDGVTMLIGGENWRRVRRRIYSTDTPKQTPAHPIAINVTATNSRSPRPRDTNAIVVTSTPRTIIEERNDDLAIRPIDRDKFGPPQASTCCRMLSRCE